MKKIKKMAGLLALLVYGCIFCYLLIAAPLLAGYRPVVVLSGSMEPAFPVGSVIYYHSAPFTAIEEGDAITFRAGDQAMVTHRVTGISSLSAEFRTKGDANESEDPNPVPYEAVLGRVPELAVPDAGYFVSYGKRAYVIGLMAAVILFNMVLDSLLPEEGRRRERGRCVRNEKL